MPEPSQPFEGRAFARPPRDDRAQCRKCRTPVNTMAMPCVVGGLDHLIVAHRAAGLDHRRGAGLDRHQQPIGEGEKGVGGDHRAFGQRRRELHFLRGILRLARGDARGIDTAHLPGADADGGAVLGIDDGVRLHVLGDAEGETQVGKFLLARRALGDGLELHVVDHRVVARLHQ